MTEFNKAFTMTITENAAMWTSYFPIRVDLTRADVRRLAVNAWAMARTFLAEELNASHDVGEETLALARNFDSALKFKSDENFVLITKAEYDKLTAAAKPSEPPVQEPSPVETRQESTVSHG